MLNIQSEIRDSSIATLLKSPNETFDLTHTRYSRWRNEEYGIEIQITTDLLQFERRLKRKSLPKLDNPEEIKKMFLLKKKGKQ